MIRIRVIQPLHIPAPVRRELRDRVPARGQQFPQIRRTPDPARIPAAHREDRDRLPFPLLHFGKTLVSLAQLGDYLLKVIAKLILVRHLEFNPQLFLGQIEDFVVGGCLKFGVDGLVVR